jgi:hypothetical protein
VLTPISAESLEAETPQVLDEEDLARRVEDEFQRRRRARDFPGSRYATKRFLVRTTRIAIGLVIGVLSLRPLDFAFKTLEQPFSSLSPPGLIVSALAAVLGIAAVVWAPRIAFGEGESREMHDARLEGEMRAAIENELRWRWQNARALEARQKSSTTYKAGQASASRPGRTT